MKCEHGNVIQVQYRTRDDEGQLPVDQVDVLVVGCAHCAFNGEKLEFIDISEPHLPESARKDSVPVHRSFIDPPKWTTIWL